MIFEMKELMPIAAILAEKYTSGESSSVSYEKAQMLMGAVIYCIRESTGSGGEIPADGRKSDSQQLYELGYGIVVDKVYEAKNIYNRLLENYEDYGSGIYRDTILRGMPEFFLHYDARFCPQDELLTLDYPLLREEEGLCGIDRILEYLRRIEWEKEFLSNFDVEKVKGLMERIQPDYRETGVDNLCAVVLFQAIGCMAAGRPVRELTIQADDLETITDCFEDATVEQLEHRLARMIELLTGRLSGNCACGYLKSAARDFAARLQNVLEHGQLGNLFIGGEHPAVWQDGLGGTTSKWV